MSNGYAVLYLIIGLIGILVGLITASDPDLSEIAGLHIVGGVIFGAIGFFSLVEGEKKE